MWPSRGFFFCLRFCKNQPLAKVSVTNYKQYLALEVTWKKGFPGLGAPALPRHKLRNLQSKAPEGSVAGVQGARYCLLAGRLAGARPHVAGLHSRRPRRSPAVGAGVLAG